MVVSLNKKNYATFRKGLVEALTWMGQVHIQKGQVKNNKANALQTGMAYRLDLADNQ